MNIIYYIKKYLGLIKDINLSELPSQGLFYPDGFKLSIKKAIIDDIIDYELNFNIEDTFVVISKIKKILENNCIFNSKEFNLRNLKSIDLIFLFFQIVTFTQNKKIEIKFTNSNGLEDIVNFDCNNFNYIKFTKSLMDKYDKSTKEFVINGFRFSVPCTGVESDLTNFILTKVDTKDYSFYKESSYDFIYFLGHKKELTPSEIENLVYIFNIDLPDKDKKIIKKIVEQFSPLVKYSLKKDNQIIEVTSKIDLVNIWK